jgi:hypothetical protein
MHIYWVTTPHFTNMFAFFLSLLIWIGFIQEEKSPLVNMQAEICGRMPTGTGLRKDRQGWIHIMKSGNYIFHNAKLLNRDKGIQQLKANQTYYIFAENDTIEWTDIDGKRGVVPTNLLYPPGEQIKKKD